MLLSALFGSPAVPTNGWSYRSYHMICISVKNVRKLVLFWRNNFSLENYHRFVFDWTFCTRISRMQNDPTLNSLQPQGGVIKSGFTPPHPRSSENKITPISAHPMLGVIFIHPSPPHPTLCRRKSCFNQKINLKIGEFRPISDS